MDSEKIILPPNHCRVVVISGPSGVGKDSVIRELQKNGQCRHFVVPATTRKKRNKEVNGIDYIFLTPTQFNTLLEENKFLEHAEVYGYQYGVPKSQVIDALEKNLDVIIKAAVQGAFTIRKLIQDSLLIFISPPHYEAIVQRLTKRKTESSEQFSIRLSAAKQELDQSKLFDHVIINHDNKLQETVQSIESILKKDDDQF